LGIGDWGLGPIPNPQSPIPNPQSPIPFKIDDRKKNYKINFYLNYLNNKIIKMSSKKQEFNVDDIITKLIRARE
jgi:hypothetical protein